MSCVVTVSEAAPPFPRPKSRDELSQGTTGPRGQKGRRTGRPSRRRTKRRRTSRSRYDWTTVEDMTMKARPRLNSSMLTGRSRCPAEMAAEIIGFNDQRQQVELSRKALLPKPYQMFRQAHRIVSG
jgi:hypothetical protein